MSDPLQTYRAAREALLAHITQTLSADKRFVAAWLTGSLSRNEADVFSDLDLTVVVSDKEAEGLCARAESVSAQTTPQRLDLFRQFGQVAGLHENNYNAPENGTFTFVIYSETGVMVDWILRPHTGAERPAQSLLLFDKVGIPICLPAESETLEWRAGQASERVAFFWMMAAITVKYIARGDGVFAANWLETLHKLIREVERLVAGEPWQYQRGSLSTLAVTRAEQLQAIQQLCDRMEQLMPKVAGLGGYIHAAPRANIERFIRLAENS